MEHTEISCGRQRGMIRSSGAWSSAGFQPATFVIARAGTSEACVVEAMNISSFGWVGYLEARFDLIGVATSVSEWTNDHSLTLVATNICEQGMACVV